VKSKISSTLVQATTYFLIKQNEQQQNLKDLKKEKNNSNTFGKFNWLSSSAL